MKKIIKTSQVWIMYLLLNQLVCIFMKDILTTQKFTDGPEGGNNRYWWEGGHSSLGRQTHNTFEPGTKKYNCVTNSKYFQIATNKQTDR